MSKDDIAPSVRHTHEHYPEPDAFFPRQETATDAPGLSGGEYPGAEGQLERMGAALAPDEPDRDATTFGGALGAYGPLGTMGTIEPGNAVDTPEPPADDTQYGLGPASQ